MFAATHGSFTQPTCSSTKHKNITRTPSSGQPSSNPSEVTACRPCSSCFLRRMARRTVAVKAFIKNCIQQPPAHDDLGAACRKRFELLDSVGLQLEADEATDVMKQYEPIVGYEFLSAELQEHLFLVTGGHAGALRSLLDGLLRVPVSLPHNPYVVRAQRAQILTHTASIYTGALCPHTKTGSAWLADCAQAALRSTPDTV